MDDPITPQTGQFVLKMPIQARFETSILGGEQYEIEPGKFQPKARLSKESFEALFVRVGEYEVTE